MRCKAGTRQAQGVQVGYEAGTRGTRQSQGKYKGCSLRNGSGNC